MIVYKATNKINNKIYIGITSISLEKRMYQHLWEAANGRSDRGLLPFHKAIKKHGKDNFVFEIIDQAEDFESLLKKETEWIMKENSFIKNGQGYNCTLGGQGTKGSIPTPEVIQKRTAHLKKQVIRIEDGKIFSSIKEAAIAIGKSKSLVGNVLSGKKRSAGGYTFMFLNDESANAAALEKRKDKDRKITERNIEGIKVRCKNDNLTFDSYKKAASYYKINPLSIKRVAEGSWKQVFGLIFEKI